MTRVCKEHILAIRDATYRKTVVATMRPLQLSKGMTLQIIQEPRQGRRACSRIIHLNRSMSLLTIQDRLRVKTAHNNHHHHRLNRSNSSKRHIGTERGKASITFDPHGAFVANAQEFLPAAVGIARFSKASLCTGGRISCSSCSVFLVGARQGTHSWAVGKMYFRYEIPQRRHSCFPSCTEFYYR